ncbi:TonB-dependent receptor [Pararhizobium sp. YC-54]|uniref:TonB-dependent receptor n=1 Tax=Pararhizobium sp. YC-54 TaxID=2986920 RepID=UPI0021F6F02A|nr:TonB-dependent receptor [Pararhizobium sp. YC-54]MCV9999528.1 TonB-dependent receptor [Pararhizobium sp. YC-54]
MPAPATTRDAGEFNYILRVYDATGRFDETGPQTLKRADLGAAPEAQPGSLPGTHDRTAVRNIPVYGGAVTVFGSNLPPSSTVRALGKTVPVSADNKFVVRQILPPGKHVVDVALSSRSGDGLSFVRDVNIPTSDWFYVGLADLTVGKRLSVDAAGEADRQRYGSVYSRGRLAFYLKGKIKGEYLLTAAADTGEDDFRNLFRGLDSKSQKELLRRIDPDDYYPVYGDDSTAIEDAPTRGKFFVRLERGDANVMWGNFKSRVEGNGLLRNERALYGAGAGYSSPEATSFGERRTEASVYAAQPETLPQRDVFRGTGGSAYFLKRQDIISGSETVTLLVTDPTTGRIISRQALTAGEDYDVDYVQGVIILRRPLSSTTANTKVVRQGAIGDRDVSLAVNYEYSPTIGNADGYSYGGRLQSWLDDHVRLGATAMSEETGPADQNMVGADIRLRHSETTYIEADYAQTKGPGFSRSFSTDGGLTLDEEAPAGRPRWAKGWTLRGQLDLADINENLSGRIGGYYERKDDGFSSLDDNIAADQQSWGALADIDLNARTTVDMQVDHFEDARGTRKTELTGEIGYAFNDAWRAVFGVGYTDLNTPGAIKAQDGSRLDGGARLEWTPKEGRKLYAFGQATAMRRGEIRRNDRIGAGAEMQLTDKLGLTGEISEGTTGIGALAALTYSPTADDTYYLGYKLDPDRAFDRLDAIDLDGLDLGGIVMGTRRRYSDLLATYAENNYDMFGHRRSLTSTYGVTYTPDTLWTVSGGFEAGLVEDPRASDFNRYAPSLSIGYRDGEDIAARIRGEVRLEDSDDGTRNRDTFLLSGGYSNKLDPDWRLLLNLDAVVSNSDQSSFLDGDYIEASIGWAYRPIENDRFNALFKYAYYHDLPGPDQVSRATDDVLGPAQRSHILSADLNYDLNRWLTVGGKYGFRFGETSTTRGGDDFTSSTAHLGVLRADFHVVNKWDFLLEGRSLYLPEANSQKWGLLAAVYRQVGENMKLGVGYNFGRFSEDLTDLTYDDQGLFLNAVGKF